VIAREKIDRDAGPAEATHGGREVETGPHVPPVAIVKVASEDHEIDLALDGRFDESVERRARGAAHFVGGHAVIPG